MVKNVILRNLSQASFFERAGNDWKMVWQLKDTPWETGTFAPGIKDIDKKINDAYRKKVLVPGNYKFKLIYYFN